MRPTPSRHGLDVQPFESRPLQQGAIRTSYSGIISALGYERRARRISEVLFEQVEARAAIAFADQTQKAHYQENKQWYAEAGFDVHVLRQEQVSHWMTEWLAGLVEDDMEPLRLAIDVSSMSRVRIARLLAPLTVHRLSVPVEVDFLYTPAQYHEPSDEPEITEVNGPVTDWFGGWSPNAREAVVAFVGLGYEVDRATGAMEYIEPGSIWAFAPKGEDVKYDERMREANKWLFEDLPGDHLLDYEVNDPFTCFSTLEGLVFEELTRGRRPVLVPMGPKIFAVISMLVALLHRPWPAVWRVSPGDYAEAQPRDTSGKLIGIRTTFR